MSTYHPHDESSGERAEPVTLAASGASERW